MLATAVIYRECGSHFGSAVLVVIGGSKFRVTRCFVLCFVSLRPSFEISVVGVGVS